MYSRGEWSKDETSIYRVVDMREMLMGMCAKKKMKKKRKNRAIAKKERIMRQRGRHA